ncbi:unnamed protein product, partial [marine sediment metagenome]
QELFARLLPSLLETAFQLGYEVRVGEVYRSPQEARRLAALGKGIVNSNHCKKLAVDLFLSEDGAPAVDEHPKGVIAEYDRKVTWDLKDYEALGERWEKEHELCRWGGRFRNRDGVHFSLEHNGVA